MFLFELLLHLEEEIVDESGEVCFFWLHQNMSKITTIQLSYKETQQVSYLSCTVFKFVCSYTLFYHLCAIKLKK